MLKFTKKDNIFFEKDCVIKSKSYICTQITTKKYKLCTNVKMTYNEKRK